jgi:predicted dehydrogenase
VTARLRVGLIGCGNVGLGLHLPAWLAQGDIAEVVALADPTPEPLATARTLAGLPESAAHADPLDLLAREDIDAVDICTPQHLHLDPLRAAARAGKHILCEKPLATTPEDSAAAVAAAEEAGVVLAVVHNYHWLPEVQAAQRVLATGEIGEVTVVTVNFLGTVDRPGAAAYQADWRHQPELSGGGVLIDMVHGVYLARELLGRPFLRVNAFVDPVVAESRVERLALCRFETAQGVGLVNIGWGHGPGGFEITGTQGRISVRYEHGRTSPWAPLDEVRVSTGTSERVELAGPVPVRSDTGFSESMYQSFDHVVQDFVGAVRDGRPPAAPGSIGHEMLEAVMGAYESGATGQTVALPLSADDPVFTAGALGVGELPLTAGSPFLSNAMFKTGGAA